VRAGPRAVVGDLLPAALCAHAVGAVALPRCRPRTVGSLVEPAEAVRARVVDDEDPAEVYVFPGTCVRVVVEALLLAAVLVRVRVRVRDRDRVRGRVRVRGKVRG